MCKYATCFFKPTYSRKFQKLKAERIEEWLKENPDHAIVRESLEALKASIPEPIAFEDLDFNFGER